MVEVFDTSKTDTAQGKQHIQTCYVHIHNYMNWPKLNENFNCEELKQMKRKKSAKKWKRNIANEPPNWNIYR